jgi:uncharacterized damage-inducible protein DinB
MRNAYLHPILKEAAELPTKVKEAFGHLSADQLNWKPNAETWSIGECLDHLITTNRTYFAQLEAISRGDKYVSFWEKLPILHRTWGKMLLKATSPDTPRKAKTTKPFHPTRSSFTPAILDEFATQQQELIRRVEKADNVDHHEMMITSPAASFITYSLHDGLVIIFQHEKRHFNQAKVLMAHPEFPKA